MGLFSSKKNASGAEQKTQSFGNSRPTGGSAQSEYREVYLVVYQSGKFKAHWSLWVPRLDSIDRKKGKLVHVRGSLSDGFELEFIRCYDLKLTRNLPTHVIEIGMMRGDFIEDGPESKTLVKDNQPNDHFENRCKQVPAPRPSLRSSDAGSNNVCTDEANRGTASAQVASKAPVIQRPMRIEIRDCQYWITQVVLGLVNAGELLPPQRGINKGINPISIVREAPKH